MTPPRSPEALELAIEVVNLIASITRPRVSSGETTLSSIGFDDLDRLCIAEEITERWHQEVTEREMRDWYTVADIAETITRLRGREAA